MDKPKLIKLSDGNTIPQLGLGVWKADNHQVVKAIHHALDTGYRLLIQQRFITMRKV
ncbi:2,5-diketo-D-gluconic acid reductase A family protein [Proteus penneri ATCC 35198]|nr:2,5-diketo-D-gluconic acid reductase A family protein [Proteus penneri ATCC 35198]